MATMIKFRAIPVIDKDDMKRFDSNYDGTFVYGHYVTAFPEYDYIVGDIIDDGEDFICPEWWVPVDPKTVEQCTGLTDVNGRDIYKGDIVKRWSDVSELTMVPSINVIVSEDLFGRPGVFLKPAGAHLIEPCLYDSWSNQFEVIGNVHENAGLLEDKAL